MLAEPVVSTSREAPEKVESLPCLPSPVPILSSQDCESWSFGSLDALRLTWSQVSLNELDLSLDEAGDRCVSLLSVCARDCARA